jgi:hypothetical protein
MPLGAGAEQVGQAAPNGRWPDVLAPAWGHCHAQVSALCIARRHRDRRNNSRPGLLQGFGTGAPPPSPGRGNSLLDQGYAGSSDAPDLKCGGSNPAAQRISIPECRGSNPAAPASQSVSNASNMKLAQKPRGTARFRRYERVSVCGICEKRGPAGTVLRADNATDPHVWSGRAFQESSSR